MPKPATPAIPQVEPKPELEKRTRRVFTPEYKLRFSKFPDIFASLSDFFYTLKCEEPL